jgi:S1-C subfamily serine protease
MEDHKNNRFDDFFNTGAAGPNDKPDAEKRAADSGEKRQTYYYSYGPYKSNGAANPAVGAVIPAVGSEGVSAVDVTAPQPVRPLYPEGASGSDTAKGTWQFDNKKRSPIRSVLISFLAGALVVSGLMFAADRLNLFGGDSGGTAGSGSIFGTSGGGVRTTALDLDRPGNIASIAKSANPAVVLIETYVKPRSNSSRNYWYDDPIFRYFFGDPYQQSPRSQGQDNSLQPSGAGSGFIYKESGYILTNQHVIDGADEIQVTVEGYSKPFTAKVLGSSYDYDLAVLKIEGDKPFPVLPIGNSDDMDVGDWVVAIGNPYGFEHTVTVGVLSHKGRQIPITDRNGQREYKHLLQTDASINPGNSGGPLLNLDGQVIGINTAISAQAQGIGFAIPTSTIAPLLDKLEKGQEIPKEPSPFIGVTLQDIDKSWVEDLKLENTDGAIVLEVQRGTPAFQGGIRQYDVITKVNGEKVANSKELQEKIKASKVGDKVTITVMRDGKPIDLTVTVGDRNAAQTQ